ncbi:hypothetical protein M426DRAFT_101140 [Hypoxylon sp. CI-4A]|nr:hypothetical protein M426DRAFT_101140 [Hypoxylon sp. CI-4A]
MSSLSIIISLGVGLAFIYVARRLLSGARHPPLPPGPRGLPFIGNLMYMPKPDAFEPYHWLKHKERYGPISSMNVAGNTIIMLNDTRLAIELLEKRAAKHSSRPRLIFVGEMIGWGSTLGLMPYGDKYRRYRKRAARLIGNTTASARYVDVQEVEVGHFLLHLLESPEELVTYIRKETGSMILKVAYGYTAESHGNDILNDMVSDAMDVFSLAAAPGTFVVDFMPFLRYLPDWFPGTGFKKLARKWRSELLATIEKPYAFARHQMAHGMDSRSFVSAMTEEGEGSPEDQHIAKWAAASLYSAGADSTVSAVSFFFLAMTIHPKVQRVAQEEIDRVVGQGRLPTTADRAKLPYVEAIVKEVLRWHPVVPMGFAHESTEDDIFEGYFIPKGSILRPNIWYFGHDPKDYHDPLEFKPERFLATDGHEPELDPGSWVFGFGRRVCPGRFLAENTLYLTIAQTLAVFNIGRVKENGQEVVPAVILTPGTVCHPAPYKNVITPRSPLHEKLIRSIEDTYPWEESDSKTLGSISY